jgi:8-oxo-dGTP pyrophosphatase MutT (NUDIX family)
MIKIKVAIAILSNKEGEILLQKKTSDWHWMPNAWICFGGHVDEGETSDECIVRELEEEIGIKANPKHLFYQETEIAEGVLTEVDVYGAEVSLAEIDRVTEGSGLAFFSKEELSSLKLFHDTKIALEKYFDCKI